MLSGQVNVILPISQPDLDAIALRILSDSKQARNGVALLRHPI